MIKSAVLYIALACFCSLSALAQTKVIKCVTSSDIGPYKESILGLKKTLTSQHINFTFKEYTLDAFTLDNSSGADLILAVGSRALELAAKRSTTCPIVFIMVANPEIKQENITGVSLNIPVAHIFSTLKRIAPGTKKLGVLYDPDQTGPIVNEGLSKAASFGLEVVARKLNNLSDEYSAIRSSINGIDAFWMVPDASIYSIETAQDILLVAIRAKIPVIGLSAYYVKAGALFSLSCDHKDIGRQGAEIAIQIFNDVKPSRIKIAHPSKMLLSINVNTARQIGMQIPDSVLKEAAHVYQ